jgi:hypothetical protein
MPFHNDISLLYNPPPCGGAIPDSDTYRPKFEPCCPPVKVDLLSGCFEKKTLMGISRYIYNENCNVNNFHNLIIYYTDYIHELYPSITQLVFHMTLSSAGTGSAPSTNTILIEERFFRVLPNDGLDFDPTNFFSAPLNQNEWYKVKAGVYTAPNAFQAFPADCSKNLFYYIRLVNGKLEYKYP